MTSLDWFVCKGLYWQANEVLPVIIISEWGGRYGFLRWLVLVILTIHGLKTVCLGKRYGREILHRIHSCTLNFIPCKNIIYSKNKYNLTFKKCTNTNDNEKIWHFRWKWNDYIEFLNLIFSLVLLEASKMWQNCYM